MVDPRYWDNFCGWNLEDWLTNNLTRELGRRGYGPWSVLFAKALDTFRFSRNKLVLKNITLESSDILIRIQARTKEVSSVFGLHSSVSPIQQGCSIIKVHWHTPPIGWMKLNTYGSIRNGGRQSSCGGLLRDAFGVFLAGFSGNLGTCTF